MLRYGRLSEKAIKMMGETAGRNCMKAKYNYSGNSQFDPYDARNIHNLEDFQQSATLGIYEHLLHNDCIKGATREQLREARRAGYRACNSQSRPLAQAEYKHLYIEQYVDDEDGNAIVNIVDVTAELHMNHLEWVDTHNEMGQLLSELLPLMTLQQLDLIIRRASVGTTGKGKDRNTYEGIAKQLGTSRQNISQQFGAIKKKARRYAKSVGLDISELF